MSVLFPTAKLNESLNLKDKYNELYANKLPYGKLIFIIFMLSTIVVVLFSVAVKPNPGRLFLYTLPIIIVIVRTLIVYFRYSTDQLRLPYAFMTNLIAILPFNFSLIGFALLYPREGNRIDSMIPLYVFLGFYLLYYLCYFIYYRISYKKFENLVFKDKPVLNRSTGYGLGIGLAASISARFIAGLTTPEFVGTVVLMLCLLASILDARYLVVYRQYDAIQAIKEQQPVVIVH